MSVIRRLRILLAVGLLSIIATSALSEEITYPLPAVYGHATATHNHAKELLVAVPGVVLLLLFTLALMHANRRLRAEIGRRRGVEEQLTKFNSSLCDTQEIAHVGSWEWNIVTGELTWSDEIYRIFGLQPRQFGATYDAFLQRVHPKDRVLVASAVNESVNHDTPYEIIHRLVRPSGELRIVSEHGRVYRDAEGKPLRMLGVIHDITQLKDTEDALRRERDTAQRYLDIAGVILLILNRDGSVKLLNRYGLKLLNYADEQQVVGRNWFIDFVPAPLNHDLFSVFNGLMSGAIPEVEKFVNPVIDSQGESHLISWQYTLLHDDDGMICGLLASGQDITQQRKTEEKLRLTDKVFEYSSEAILITDHENRIVAANAGFINQTGYALQEVLGQNPNILKSGQHDQAFYQQMWQALNDRGQWSGEVWDRRKDGSIYPKWLSINVVRDPETMGILHYIAIFSDLTQRKAAEEEIRYLAHHDPLTDLPNRLYFDERLRQALAKALRHENHVAVLFIDLDRFKPINDTYGHHIGDLLLQEIAHRLAKCVRESDTVARLGGDEFVILLEGIEESISVQRVNERVIREVNREVIIEGHSLSVSASIGISLSPFDGEDPATLMQHADSAMYEAKKHREEHYCYFSSPDQIKKRDADTP